MEGISYLPAVHTDKYFSRYSLLPNEIVVNIYPIFTNIYCQRVNIGWSRSNDYIFETSYCLFFTNLGRVIPSLTNVKDIEMQKINDNGYGQSTLCASLQYSYEGNKIKYFSTYNNCHTIPHQLVEKVGLPLDKEVTFLDIEPFPQGITIKTRNNNELNTLRKEKKEYDELKRRIEHLKTLVKEKPNDFLGYLEYLLSIQEQVNNDLEELEEWRIYAKIKRSFHRAENS